MKKRRLEYYQILAKVFYEDAIRVAEKKAATYEHEMTTEDGGLFVGNPSSGCFACGATGVVNALMERLEELLASDTDIVLETAPYVLEREEGGENENPEAK